MPNKSQSNGVPDRRSWGSLRPSTYSMSVYSQDDDVSPRTSTHPRNTQSRVPICPLSNTQFETRGPYSPVSAIAPIDFARTEEARKGSDATVWPTHATSVKKPTPVVKHKQGKEESSQDTWKIGDFYRNARGIYKTGPKGEGQKLWKSYKITEQMKKQILKFEPTASTERRPSAGLAAHPPSRKTLERSAASWRDKAHAAASRTVRATSPRVQTKAEKGKGPVASIGFRKASDVSRSSVDVPATHQPSTKTSNWTTSKGKGKVPVTNPDPRKPSEVSRSSLEVPFGIHPDIQQFVDTSKALPRVPKLQPAPRQRGHTLSKALPPVPQLHGPPKSRLRPDAYTKPLVPSTYVPPRRGWIPSRASDEISPKSTIVPSKAIPQWWKKPALPSLVPIPHIPKGHTRDTSASTSSTTATKPTISRPRQISRLSTTANIPAAMGGVGGPSTLRAPPYNQTEKKDRKAAHFREDVFGNARKDSDVRFRCAGEGGVSGGKWAVRKEGDGDVPRALFSGRDEGKGKERGTEGSRDTKFYQAYV